MTYAQYVRKCGQILFFKNTGADMKKTISILFPLSLFCIVLLILYGGPVMAAPQSETEAEDETDTSSVSWYEFTVERGTISMPDGVKLAVSYWRPTAKKPGEKFPVFFEMNGYRKDDLCYLSWDYPVGAYFAKHGYVVAKVGRRSAFRRHHYHAGRVAVR